ncbi:hypothetical protein FACS189438_2230 [Bacteroidia bacterium]|nr:hypothetical protein FACS189438_2230 [Bacteroidia bacterium]
MEMIRKISLAVLVAVGFATSGMQAQVRINMNVGQAPIKTEAIDDVLFSAEYKMTFVIDTAKRDRPLEETMMLVVGSKVSLFHSYSKFIADSIIAANVAAGASMETIAEKVRGFANQIDYKIYKNYPAGKVTTLDQVAGSRFRCEETNERPDWELLPDTMTILSYPCQKAVCLFKGRTYEAWYTSEIAKSDGPWKLHGLPGLILKASDSWNEYSFECIALAQPQGKETIQYGASGYEPLSRSALDKQYERYAADPIGYVQSSNPNARIVIKGQDGQEVRPKNTPYNPIELAGK